MHDDTDEPTIATVAHDALAYFTTSTRADGSTFVHTIHVTPDWLDALIRDAHGDMLPDDWRYGVIRDFLMDATNAGQMSDGELDDFAQEWASESVDIYTADLLRWLCSHGERLGYCDEYCENCGGDESEPMESRIRGGQYMERAEVVASVVQSLRSRLGDLA